jgi:hypothetical protein
MLCGSLVSGRGTMKFEKIAELMEIIEVSCLADSSPPEPREERNQRRKTHNFLSSTTVPVPTTLP